MVLDGVDGTFLDPVDGVSEVGSGENLGVVLLVLWHNLGTEESLVLEVGVGGELVVSNGERGLGGVDLLDLGGLLVEDVKSELVLLLGSVGESKLSNVVNESGLDLNRDRGSAVSTEVRNDSAKGVHDYVCFVIKYKQFLYTSFISNLI